jgi:hypothetical protein
MTVDIDEQAPTLTIEPQDPQNPAQVVVATSDSESPVASGQIEIAPRGTTNWIPLNTTLTGNGQLIATVPDSSLSGPYTVQATACSRVGNCGSTSESVNLPLRLASIARVSLGPIRSGLIAERVRERVRVGWHWRRVRHGGHVVYIKVGGHLKTVTIVRYVSRCSHPRVRGHHRRRASPSCSAPRITVVKRRRVAFGAGVRVRGLLVTGEDVPLAGVPVQVFAAPVSDERDFRPVARVTTSSDGSWTVRLRPGPSRVIRATYGGSPRLLPASDQATVTVPARIRIAAQPRMVPWHGQVTIHGRLLGGYVPRDGVALRLLVRYPHTRGPTVVVALRTDSRGRFRLTWSYGAGRGIVTYPFWISTTANESDYPFAAAASRRVLITFGRAAPPPRRRR